MFRRTRPDDHHALDGIEQQLYRFNARQLCHTGLVEGDVLRRNADDRLMNAGEHFAADHLKRTCQLVILPRVNVF